MLSDASAAGDALLHGDFDEGRFRIHLLILKAEALGLPGLSAAAQKLGAELGPMGRPPGTGYGASLLQVADELETMGLNL